VTNKNSLNLEEQYHSANLMRINHVGEVCAQALYNSQGCFAQDEKVIQQFREAAIEEQDHLVWTAERIRELGSHVSLLNPIWYAGSYLIGILVGSLGDKHSLSFVLETELQVEAHLDAHLQKLPLNDLKSRAIIEQMHNDEILHGRRAQALGAIELPNLVRKIMQTMSKVMIKVSYHI